MDELQDEQVCPYCDHVVEDYQSNWDEDEEKVKCRNCDKVYKVKAVYKFEGFQIDKQCEKCGTWTDDGFILCGCEEEDE